MVTFEHNYLMTFLPPFDKDNALKLSCSFKIFLNFLADLSENTTFPEGDLIFSTTLRFAISSKDSSLFISNSFFILSPALL